MNLLGKIGDQLEVIHDLATCSSTALDTKGQHTTETAFEVLLRSRMTWMAFQTRVRDPGNVLVLLQPVCHGKGVGRMSFTSQAQCLNTKEKLLSSKRVERSTKIPKNLDTDANSIGNGAKGFPELETVIPLRRLNELWESLSVFTPVEFTAVNDDTSNSCAVTTDPFRGAVDDNICTVLDGLAEVSASTESIVNLSRLVSFNFPNAFVHPQCTGHTINGTPLSCATLARASKSGTLYRGFPIVST